MKSLVISIGIVGIVGVVIGVTVWGATIATVTTTVSAVNLAISRSDGLGDINYGSVNVNTTTSTNPTGTGQLTTTFSNDGSQAKFEVNTGNSTNWFAASTSTTADTFMHKFTTSTADVYWKTMGTASTYVTASSTVDASESMNMWMELSMPVTSSFYTQQSITVTVQASAP